MRCTEYKGYLKHQNYNEELVERRFKRALKIERSQLLEVKVKTNKKVFPLVLDFNPILPDISKVINKHLHLLRSSPQLKEIFPPKSIFPAYRRTKNLKEISARSKVTPVNGSLMLILKVSGAALNAGRSLSKGQTYVSEHLPKICEHLPKITEDSRGRLKRSENVSIIHQQT